MSPLRLDFYQKDQPEEKRVFLICLPDLPDDSLAVRPEQGDALVLIALALSLHFASSFWSGFRTDHRVFYSRLVGEGRVRTSQIGSDLLFKYDVPVFCESRNPW